MTVTVCVIVVCACVCVRACVWLCVNLTVLCVVCVFHSLHIDAQILRVLSPKQQWIICAILGMWSRHKFIVHSLVIMNNKFFLYFFFFLANFFTHCCWIYRYIFIFIQKLLSYCCGTTHYIYLNMLGQYFLDQFSSLIRRAHAQRSLLMFGLTSLSSLLIVGILQWNWLDRGKKALGFGNTKRKRKAGTINIGGKQKYSYWMESHIFIVLVL